MLSDLMTNSDSEVKLILGLFSPIWWCRDIQCSDILENDIFGKLHSEELQIVKWLSEDLHLWKWLSEELPIVKLLSEELHLEKWLSEELPIGKWHELH